MSEKEWEKRADASFEQDGSSSGTWKRQPDMPDQWYVRYQPQGMNIKFRLGLTRFKHVGIFPEQAVNWDFIHQQSKSLGSALPKPPKVLNLFAYTGGASLAARAAGADVIHCDSIKQVVNWANANQEASKLKDIRWLVEDAFKFVKREANRDRRYNGIILDPPAWGHGPKGEKWKLEDQINELVEYVAKILAPLSVTPPVAQPMAPQLSTTPQLPRSRRPRPPRRRPAPRSTTTTSSLRTRPTSRTSTASSSIT